VPFRRAVQCPMVTTPRPMAKDTAECENRPAKSSVKNTIWLDAKLVSDDVYLNITIRLAKRKLNR